MVNLYTITPIVSKGTKQNPKQKYSFLSIQKSKNTHHKSKDKMAPHSILNGS